MRRTSSRCSIRLYPGQNGRFTDVIENSKVRMSRYLDTSAETQLAKIMVQYGRSSSFFLGEILYGHHLAGLSWERQFEKVLSKYGWGKVPNWERLFVNCEKGLFLFVYVDFKLAGKKQNISPTWKILMKDVDLGEVTSFLDRFFFWVALNVSAKQAKVLWTITEICLNPKSLPELQKNCLILKNWRKHLLMVQWYGRSYKEMRGKDIANLRIKRLSNCKNRNNVHWRPSI